MASRNIREGVGPRNATGRPTSLSSSAQIRRTSDLSAAVTPSARTGRDLAGRGAVHVVLHHHRQHARSIRRRGSSSAGRTTPAARDLELDITVLGGQQPGADPCGGGPRLGALIGSAPSAGGFVIDHRLQPTRVLADDVHSPRPDASITRTWQTAKGIVAASLGAPWQGHTELTRLPLALLLDFRGPALKVQLPGPYSGVPGWHRAQAGANTGDTERANRPSPECRTRAGSG